MPPRVRGRTLAHLDALLAMTVLASGCHTPDPGYGVVDPMPNPAQDDPPRPPEGDGSTRTIPEASGTTPPPRPVDPPPKPPDPSYMVVDPMPAPAECTVFADTIYARATAIDGAISVQATISGRFRFHATLDPTGNPTAANASMSGVSLTEGSWTFRVTPDPSVHTVSISLAGMCEGVPANATLRLNWAGPLEKDTPVSTVVIGVDR